MSHLTSPPVSLVRRHPVVSFFLLAYLLSWGAIPWNSFFAPGVLISALVIVGLTEGRAGYRALGARLIRWRVSWIWYALAIAVPLVVHLVTASVNVGLGAQAPVLTQFSPWFSLPMAIGLHIVDPTGGPLFEEPSFRGLAQARLQRDRSPLAATAIMAIGVTVWHLPLFVMPAFGSRPIEALTTVAVTFWYAWLFNHASGSSLITLIAHGTEGSIDSSSLWSSATDTTRETWLYCVVWCAVAVVLLIGSRRFWTRRAAPNTIDSVSASTAQVRADVAS